MRSATQPYCNIVEYGLRMRFFPQNFGTIKRILPGSSSPSHREGPGIEVGADFHFSHRRGGKILGGMHVICNMPFVMLREEHKMANQSPPGGWSKILEGLNTF